MLWKMALAEQSVDRAFEETGFDTAQLKDIQLPETEYAGHEDYAVPYQVYGDPEAPYVVPHTTPYQRN